MKIRKLFYCAIIGVAITGSIFSCQKADSSECEKMKIAEAKLNENIKNYETTWDAIVNQGKIELIDQKMFDKNVTLVSTPKNIVGIEAFKDYYKNFLVGFSGIKFTIIDTFGQDDRIVKHWRFEGKHTGVFFGIPATGKNVNIEGVTLVKMKNGKIMQEQDFMDNLEFMNQLGIIPRQ
ncbi:ester cyclase [Flavobacterium sp. N3904]|uniref:ester cyclase n=1 Tax=Flavobacterium sp. N3904 TaxID=2986835 RepID=UPI0022255CB8|nr:ester cyclase [Flavobacterium sp. N3904]